MVGVALTIHPNPAQGLKKKYSYIYTSHLSFHGLF
jgi:hypothetical protein